MTSNTMNFGPEWMRRLSKPTTPGTLDLSSRVSYTNSSLPTSPLTSPGVNGNQGSFTYSTIAATNTSRRNTLNQDSSEDSFKAYPSESNLDDQLNPFKYSKELMLSLYKHVAMPLDFERHEYVTSEESLQPMANIPLDESEKKLLSGSVNSDLTRRIVQASTNTATFIRNERNPSRSGLATPPRSRGGYTQNPKEFQSEVEQKLEQDLSRFGRNTPRDGGLAHDDSALWTGITKRVVGTFDNDGVFRFDNSTGIDLHESLEPVEKPCHTPESLEGPESTKPQEFNVESHREQPPSNFSSTKPIDKHSAKQSFLDSAPSVDNRLDPSQIDNIPYVNNDLAKGSMPSNEKLTISTNPNLRPEGPPNHPGFKKEDLGGYMPPISRWLYKDPAGNVQGPFSSEEMQEWYSAGFFPPSLLVKREGDPAFEPLGLMVRQIGDEEKPFLTQRPLHLPHQQIRSQFNRNFLSLPSSPVADKYNPNNIGSGRGGFDPFGAPLTSGFEQNAMGFRRHLESQSRRLDINLDSKMGGASPWGNNLFSPPLNGLSPSGNTQFFGENVGMNGAGFGPDDPRAAFERHHYLQAIQQRQKMQMQQFLQFQQHPPQQPHSSGYQNDLMGNLMPQMSAQPNLEPMLANRGVAMSPTGNNWGVTNGMDMFKEPSPFPQLSISNQRDPWAQTKPLSSPGGGWSGLGAVTSGISLATEFDNLHTDNPMNSGNPGFPDQSRSELTDSNVSALAQLRLDDDDFPEVTHTKNFQKDNLVEGELIANGPATLTGVSQPKDQPEPTEKPLDKANEIPEEPQKPIISATSTPNAWSRAGSASGSPSINFAPLAPWAKVSDEESSAHSSPRTSFREIQEVESKLAESLKAEKQTPSADDLAILEAQELHNQEVERAAAAAAWQSTNAPKKSILEIQKEEEEASKLRLKLQENQTRGNNAVKRYADTVAASSTPKPAPITGWTTILGGKSTATKPASSDSKVVDSAVNSVGRPSSQISPKPSEYSNGSKRSATNTQTPKSPSPEFLNWCRNALKGLNGINTDDLIQMLLTFPLDPPPATMDIISESVYAYSSSMDGRRFAAEYVKRRKVDAGLISPAVLESTPSAQPIANSFQVVTKKKGRKNV
ncbi:kinesin-like protein [Basidiobolus ranarum]|uniref:Kinesin-like protein n=1 Tax=Basidiobolus ranarum TaxID=34480 RepID=A0ABR2VZ75_9FUNG